MRGRCEKIISLESRRLCILKATRRNEVRDESELLDQRVIEFTPALICWEFFMPVGRDFERVPGDDHGARLFLAVKTQKEIGKTENRAGRFSSAPQDGLWQCVIGAVRKGIPVDDEKRTSFRGQ